MSVLDRCGRFVPWLLAAFSIAVASGCTVAMYPGPKRPATETARIVAQAPSSVRNIDGMDLPVGSTFTVLPGIHAITVGSADAMARTSCFKAEAGHSYSVTLEGGDHDAAVSVMDVSAEAFARSIEVAPGGNCAAVAGEWQPRPRPAPRPLAAVVPAAPVPTSAASDDDEADEGEDQLTPPPARAPVAVDSETPQAPRSPRGSLPRLHVSTSDEEDPIWARHPGNGPIFELGAFVGGTDLATTYDQNGNAVGTLSGGSGVVLGFGWMWTPLWAGDGAGFGLGAEVSLKYDSVSAGNSSLSLLRFPVALAAHTFLRLTDRYWILLRGGVQKELGVDLSAEGATRATATPRWTAR